MCFVAITFTTIPNIINFYMLKAIVCHSMAQDFVRAMPDEFKFDTSIDTFTAYKMYIASKPWVASNYLRDPSRKPDWV